MPANDKSRPIGVPPGHDLRRKLVIVSHPDRNRLQEVNNVELGGCETFDERGPATDQRRLFGVEPLVLEVALGVGDEQRRCIGDRKITEPDNIVLGGMCGIGVSSQCSERRPKSAGSQHVKRLAIAAASC